MLPRIMILVTVLLAATIGPAAPLELTGAGQPLVRPAAATPNLPPTPSVTSEVTPPSPKAALLSSMDALDDAYKLAIGDQLSFRIVEDQEDPKALVVTDSGELEVPYLGRVPALDKTCRQLAQELKTELEKEYYYQATVILAVDLMTKSRGKVYLVGQVRIPGPQDIPSDEVLTVSKAILRAGGFADFADKKHVKMTRKTNDGPTEQVLTYELNLVEILEKGRTDKDMKLEPGDLIFVPSRLLNL